jgi:hypothetical protein
LDAVHARCVAYVVRRLRSLGFEVETEVEIGSGRHRGWIDVLAFRPADSLLLCIEIKTRVDDLGAILRNLGWNVRSSRAAARRFGWTASRVVPALLVLATEETQLRLLAASELLGGHLPGRADGLIARLEDADATLPEPTMALIDPRRRGGRWLIRPRMHGGRTRAPYRDYADAAVRLGQRPGRSCG